MSAFRFAWFIFKVWLILASAAILARAGIFLAILYFTRNS